MFGWGLHHKLTLYEPSVQVQAGAPVAKLLGEHRLFSFRPGQYFVSGRDGGIAANVNAPIFNGFLALNYHKGAHL